MFANRSSPLRHLRAPTRASGPFPRVVWNLALAGVWLVTGCAAQPPAVPAPAGSAPTQAANRGATLESEAAARQRIETEINGAPCTQDAQCKTLAVGEKACGGPQGWMAWSVLAGRPEVLNGLAGELAAMQRQRYQRSGMMSDCRFVPDPGAMCRAQRCMLRAPGGAN